MRYVLLKLLLHVMGREAHDALKANIQQHRQVPCAAAGQYF